MIYKASRCFSEFFLRKDFLFLFLLYIFTHGLLLIIPNSIFWDDWIISQMNYKDILELFSQTGSVFNFYGWVHVIFLYFGPWFYKALTFLLMFFSAFLIDLIFRDYRFLNFLDFEKRFVFVLLFLILPYYWARVAMIDMVYTLSYFLFFLAWYLMKRNKAISALLFFFSFNTNSLLVFYFLPVSFYFLDCLLLNGFKKIFKFTILNSFFLIIPFLFFFIKRIFYIPYGLYQGYNQNLNISLKNIYDQFCAQYLSNYNFLLNFFFDNSYHFFFFFFLAFFFFALLLKFRYFRNKLSYLYCVFLLFLGVGISFIGSFPYWSLNYIGTFNEWTSRHQLLLPLGMSFICLSIFYSVGYFFRISLISMVVSLCIVTNVQTYKDFYFDWDKQTQLIELFKSSDVVRRAQLIVINDRTKDKNAIHRTYRAYEWNGLMVRSFGNENRLAVDQADYEDLKSGKFYEGYFTHGKQYLDSGFDPHSANHVAIVKIDFEPIQDKTIFSKIICFLGGEKYKLETIVSGIYTAPKNSY